MSYSFGAIAKGSTGATIEHANGAYLLACVRGVLSTPALESIKSTFYRLAASNEAAAKAVAAAAPLMLADAVAIVLIADGTAYIACAGDGVVVRQRDGVTTRIDGAQVLAPGDALVASVAPLGITGSLFATPAAPGPVEFRNDTIDAELQALVGATTIAVAAVRCPPR